MSHSAIPVRRWLLIPAALCLLAGVAMPPASAKPGDDARKEAAKQAKWNKQGADRAQDAARKNQHQLEDAARRSRHEQDEAARRAAHNQQEAAKRAAHTQQELSKRAASAARHTEQERRDAFLRSRHHVHPVPPVRR